MAAVTCVVRGLGCRLEMRGSGTAPRKSLRSVNFGKGANAVHEARGWFHTNGTAHMHKGATPQTRPSAPPGRRRMRRVRE